MSNTVDKMGGPAFPQAHPDMCIEGQSVKETQGVTLWDYYAAAALTGLIAAYPDTDCGHKGLCHDAGIFADAMLAERAKRMEES
jgi:hypothetical protein